MTGDELRACREEMTVRPDAMAEKLGLPLHEYEQIEDGEDVPHLYHMAVTYMLEHPEDRPRVRAADRQVDMQTIPLWGDGLYDGRRWGPWRLNKQSLTLDLNSRVAETDRDEGGNPVYRRVEDYYIILSEVTNAKAVVDWIGQINGKEWGPALLGYLAEAFDDIFSLQGRFAHDTGFANFEDTQAYLEKVIKDRPDAELEEAKSKARNY